MTARQVTTRHVTTAPHVTTARHVATTRRGAAAAAAVSASCSRVRRRGEDGQVTLLVLGYTLVAALLVMGTLAVTSAQLSRVRLLDAADGAALDAADSLDLGAYRAGIDGAVAVNDETVRRTATAYLAERPLPPAMRAWQVSAGTGSPDGQTAVVRLTGEADLPFVGPLLDAFGSSVTITVESRARADLEPVP